MGSGAGKGLVFGVDGLRKVEVPLVGVEGRVFEVVVGGERLLLGVDGGYLTMEVGSESVDKRFVG